ncbi:hypothetical protein EGI26_09675 [Lacihabitans sp. CCS-44]|uniref:hypothetical protein n=1 Tax=Lacihabitans sp. CCS-44 TaxID=2487331 RepID=UPI0020CD6568|nr:hypothetical protein [Lacihabitans sp. CCS-44]MCP9755421.1 hypothetical protein [Lacihabitans sp. CCS-44]
MKTKIKTIFSLILLLGLNACQQSGSNESDSTLDSLAVTDTTLYPENLEASSFPNGELVHETGILKKFEDGGYPFATLTIEFPERKMEETFSLNLEEVKNIDQEVLSQSTGKYLDFSYASNFENALMDIQNNGKSIFKTDIIPVTKEMKNISGVLSGAKEVTGGDLPNKVSVSNANQTLDFEYYVTDEMVKYNGKTITVFYEERSTNNLVEVKILK